jgi:outer membrane protein assembly factor BamB
MQRGRSLLVAMLALVPLSSARAENWPQWRGPSLNGLSRETGLPVRWSRTDNIAWKIALPAWSGSTPIVWGDRVFVSVAEGAALQIWCLDKATGAVRWKRPLGQGNVRMRKQNMSTPTPVTDGQHVWVMTGTGILTSFDMDGQSIWSRDVQKEYGRFGLNWGYGSSPLLFGDSLFVQVLHGMKTDDPSYLLRIHKGTGRTSWRVERPTQARLESPDAYTTPAVVRVGDAFELIVTGGDVVTGHDLQTGRELWRADGLNPGRDGFHRIVASPVVHGDLVIAPSRERPLLALRPGGRGDVSRSHVRWTFSNGPDVPTPVTDGTYVYAINDRGIVWCLEAATGREVYGRQRLRSATYSGSPILAEGRIYITDEDGVTSVIQAGPAFALLSENDLGEYTLSSPAVSGGQIFIRTESFLYAIGTQASGKTP